MLYKMKPLTWNNQETNVIRCASPTHYYTIRQIDDKQYNVIYNELHSAESGSKLCSTLEEAKHWIEYIHVPSKLSQWFIPQKSNTSINDAIQWFKDAKPSPTTAEILTQFGAHTEEFLEMLSTLDLPHTQHITLDRINSLKNLFYKSEVSHWFQYQNSSTDYKVELLDALCDQIFTAIGIATMMGFDIESAFTEVVRSNDTKRLQDGTFTYNEVGKIMKPEETYKEPNLDSFINPNTRYL